MSSGEPLHQLSEAELAIAWRFVGRTLYFEDLGEFTSFWREAPWRVQMTDREELVVVVRWRAHLDLLAMLGVWCNPGRIPAVVRMVDALASEHCYAGILSPLVPVNASGPYVKAGMQVRERIAILQLREKRHRPDADSVPGVALREGSLADVPRILEADASAFEPFWRSDEADMRRLVGRMRCVVAEAAGELIGYTLCTVNATGGTLGRLCVVPARRHAGIGRMLLAEALDHMWRNGADQVTLSTQEENVAALSLYRTAGFKRLPGTSLLLASDVSVRSEDRRETSRDGETGGAR